MELLNGCFNGCVWCRRQVIQVGEEGRLRLKVVVIIPKRCRLVQALSDLLKNISWEGILKDTQHRGGMQAASVGC